MLIDGCFIPDEIYEQQRQYACATKKTRSVGVICIRKPRPMPTDGLALAKMILDPFASLRAPEWLRYWIGPTADELRQSNECALILHITPHAEPA
jgi:hypothetical protein